MMIHLRFSFLYALWTTFVEWHSMKKRNEEDTGKVHTNGRIPSVRKVQSEGSIGVHRIPCVWNSSFELVR